MSYHIQYDNRAQEFPAHKGESLPWTLYDGTLVHGLFATRKEAEAELAEVILETREEVDRLRQELEEAEDILDELLEYKSS